jgi:hypothetical protein
MFVITLTLHVIECSVKAPPLESCSDWLPGWAEAGNVNTDHVWEHFTSSSVFRTITGVGYYILSRFVAKYINFDLTVESTCSSTTSTTFYQAT